ncbi:NAD(P)/FAD-dependent oxidoreductase [Nocardioides sp. Kera G14]|uniref:NAD(P)/FAD-dependent oxidoreductase n=1 Tax=Nocardioides sp. Kera G14 TaxID=2884264 RepID=UPI001D12F45B|nr:FAD-dependent oxidoreductase [Nocardioides sp. Kera G14]UDY22602.1 FAD-binding oxidoreductase [Nocardioides sp. Kera G14]
MHPSLQDSVRTSYWLDDQVRPAPLPPLVGAAEADLVVVGGGYTGLWTALLARERFPEKSVLLLEAGQCGDQASGRNGGFASASLTHGFGNGLERWPSELDALDRLGAENLREIGATIERLGIDCDWRLSGELAVATQPHQVEELHELSATLAEHGVAHSVLDQVATRARLDSPTYLGGLALPDETALLEPARLAWGLRAACLEAGVVIHEGSRVTSLQRASTSLRLTTDAGWVRAGQVALATNAFPSLLRRLRLMTVPVYDYVLITEPLSGAQLASIGWGGREGVGDSANLFHYYRLTRDNRILWGGYDAVYHYGSKISPVLETSGRTHDLLAAQFFETFPQLEGLRFTHRWAGVIDTCTRFSAFFGTAYGGSVAYALGYTGLGVAATRFGAQVMLDHLAGEITERTKLEMVRTKPLPFPPEPFRWAGIKAMTASLEASDAHGGRRNLFLRSMDRLGFGFDS